jgi:hypothetical protein
MKNENIILIVIIYALFSILPANADIVWPSLYIAKGMTSLNVILAGTIVELLFVKYFAEISWKTALLTTIVMNFITTALGIILIPVSGLGSELIFDFVFHAYDKFGIGTFHWSHWIVSYLLVILINTLIECIYIKLTLKLELKKIFGWMLFANGISVFLCFLFLFNGALSLS